MKRTTKLGRVLIWVALAVSVSCSPSKTPVQEGMVVGKWQRVDKPAISMTFPKDGTSSAQVAGQRPLGGTYRLVNAGIVLDCDGTSPKPGSVTNPVWMAAGNLVIAPTGQSPETYKRVEEQTR